MFVKVTSLLALIAAVAAQSLQVNTPAAVVQCQPAQITWTANGAVFLSIIPGGQAGAAALQDFGQQSGGSYTWTVNIAAGTSITVQVRDSTGAVAYSAPVTIQSSSDSSCLGAQASTAAGSSSAAATTPVASSSAAASTSAALTSAVSSASQAVSSAVSSISTATAPATTSRASSSAASVISTSRTGSASASGANASSTASGNGALPTAKVGLAGLLGLAAAVVMA